MNKSDKTNLTELAEFFGVQTESPTTTKVKGIAPRFIKAGDTLEQSLARQQESFDRIKAKARGEA